MKIVHLCLGCFYPDNYSYQENLLPKFHKQLGYDVEVIASTQSFDEHGKTCFLDNVGSYQNEYDIKVTRLAYKWNNKLGRKLKRYKGTYEAIKKANPDFLFIHGGQFLDIDIVVDYLKKHKDVKVVVDNHADFSNSGTNWFSINIVHKILWKHCLNIIEPYTLKFFGVLPARVDFLVDIYGLPKEKCELLVMGADDELVEAAAKPEVRKVTREKYGISEDDFLIMTGGKIDKWKTQTLLLMEAVQNIDNDKVKLIVFGSVAQELMDSVKELSDGTKVQYIGWIKSEESYEYYAAADLVVFPGRHSVFWEQVAGQGVPMIVKDWPGTHHIDVGGNVVFIDKDSSKLIEEEIYKMLIDKELYKNMKRVAKGEAKHRFSYKSISKRAIELVDK